MASHATREPVKVVVINTLYVEAEPVSFKSIVQNLTGKDSHIPETEESSAKGTRRNRVGSAIDGKTVAARDKGCSCNLVEESSAKGTRRNRVGSAIDGKTVAARVEGCSCDLVEESSAKGTRRNRVGSAIDGKTVAARDEGCSCDLVPWTEVPFGDLGWESLMLQLPQDEGMGWLWQE
ncbi:uncharacterized protein LOC116214955 [Punica granatum]|uniref:Uncharacterized protein LOC116214955 n=1 Tax=Punica granatum TaxID=22663 RepID=A0A218VUB4_PUNGR|nr:uncharacterized protein LOC116214955 [Punica granatum]OWM63869.1 hypothetical protein CDL15_Pgr006131 [Punica granatum]